MATFSITRLEERDGPVYIGLEAIALSRDVPISLRWIVDPIVRRVSRNSLEISLRQTERAVQSRAALTAWGTPGGLCSGFWRTPLGPASCVNRVIAACSYRFKPRQPLLIGPLGDLAASIDAALKFLL
jgi:hypothetical protein